MMGPLQRRSQTAPAHAAEAARRPGPAQAPPTPDRAPDAMTRSPATARRPAAVHEMHGHGSDHPSDTWVVNLEAASALLIAFGSLLAFAAAAGVLPPSGIVLWGLDCLFPLQFPVFYFCSGYLYQRYRTVRTGRAWAANLEREAVVLLGPFVAFTVLSLLANTAAGTGRPLTLGNLAEALLVNPIEPLGYFPTCLILYAITPTVISRRGARGLLIAALACKIAVVALFSLEATATLAAGLPFLLVSAAGSWIWFAAGVALSLFRALPLLRGREKAWALGALWIAASIITFAAGWFAEASHGLLDAIGLLWLVSLFSTTFRSGIQNAFFRFVSRDTMAFWLVPPPLLKLLFAGLGAAGLSAAAFPWLYGGAGLLVCFGGPVLVMALLARAGKLAALIYPARFLPPAPSFIEKKGGN